MKTVSASVLLMLLGVWAAWAITGGFEVLTSEQARRLEISRKQPVAPDVRLIDQSGQAFRFGGWVKESNKFLIVDFIYTSCQSFCRALGTEFQQLQQGIIARGLQNRVHLLSVSFDPEHDNYSVLEQYAGHLQARPDIWTFATVENVRDLGVMLRTFGITVIPDRQGGFQHNVALIWVSPSGHLVRVTDYDFSDPLQLLNELASLN
jgi:protein SCO1/2